MINNKYTLTDETTERKDITKLYRIKALKDFDDIKKGDLGGFIESDKNLSYADDDNSWIYENSIAMGDSFVRNNSYVMNNSYVNNSRVNDSTVNNSRVNNSYVINYSYVVNSEVVNNSEVRDSIVRDSIVRDSTVRDSKIGNVTINNSAKIISGNIVNKNSWLSINNVGSENGILTAYINKDNKISVTRGCYHGTLDEFEKRVEEVHKDSNPKVYE